MGREREGQRLEEGDAVSSGGMQKLRGLPVLGVKARGSGVPFLALVVCSGYLKSVPICFILCCLDLYFKVVGHRSQG